MDTSVELLLREFEHDKLYGAVEIKFENGRVVLIKKSETIKPALHGDTNREDEEKTSRSR